MAVRVSAESGFDPGYMLKGQAEQAAREKMAGGYYINAAQAGEVLGVDAAAETEFSEFMNGR